MSCDVTNILTFPRTYSADRLGPYSSTGAPLQGADQLIPTRGIDQMPGLVATQAELELARSRKKNGLVILLIVLGALIWTSQ